MKPIRAVFTAAMTAALTVCEARAGSGPPNDVWLASKAKVSLLTTEGLGVKDVHVAAVAGVVTLHGSVRTDEEKARAGSVVSEVPGVTSVKNLMRVAPQAFGAMAKPADDQIRRSVDSALRADRSLDKVKVVSVENAVVLLEGNAAGPEDVERAIELAWAVHGVSRVTSRIEARK